MHSRRRRLRDEQSWRCETRLMRAGSGLSSGSSHRIELTRVTLGHTAFIDWYDR